MAITSEDIQKYVELGGNLNILTKAQRASLPQETILKYLLNGGDLSDLSEEQMSAIPQSFFDQHYLKDMVRVSSYSWPILEKIAAIPQDIVIRAAADYYGSIRLGLTYEQVAAIPQEIINRYVANGGYLLSIAYPQIIAAIPQEIINQRVANGGHLEFLTDAQIAAIPQEIINQRVAKEGTWYGLTEAQIAAIPQEIVNQLAANGEDLYHFSSAQRAAIPQEIVNQRAANGVYLSDLTEDQIEAIPQEIVNQLAANGGPLAFLTDEQKANIPQDVINQYVANGGYLGNLTYDQIAMVPQEFVNQHAENTYGDILRATDAQKAAIPQEIINLLYAEVHEAKKGAFPQYRNVPDQIKHMSEKAKEAIILYGARKISSSELPADVYANYGARKSLLTIIKHKTRNEFVKMCESAGYDKYAVPAELIQAFDERLAGIEEEVKAKMIDAVKKLTYPAEQKRIAEAQKQKNEMQRQKEEGQKQKAKIQNLKDDIMEMEW